MHAQGDIFDGDEWEEWDIFDLLDSEADRQDTSHDAMVPVLEVQDSSAAVPNLSSKQQHCSCSATPEASSSSEPVRPEARQQQQRLGRGQTALQRRKTAGRSAQARGRERTQARTQVDPLFTCYSGTQACQQRRQGTGRPPRACSSCSKLCTTPR